MLTTHPSERTRELGTVIIIKQDSYRCKYKEVFHTYIPLFR